MVLSHKEVRLVLELIYEKEHLQTVEPDMNTINKFQQKEHTHASTRNGLISGEPRTGIVSRLETQQGTAATHILESRGHASSAGLKHSKAQQPLTL